MKTVTNFSKTELSRSESIAWHILQIRYWQHLLNEMLKEKRFQIPIHLAFGHEAAAVALDQCMRHEDKLCLSHRNVAYNLARSKSLSKLLKHYNLEDPSCTGANMGSMNLAMDKTGIAYSSSILGNNLGVAAGIAMNRSLTKKPGVVFVVTGDGAIEEGIFWETLVFQKSHKLPVVVVIENNNYSLSSSISQRRTDIKLDHVCAGIGVQYLKAYGASFQDCEESIGAARKIAAAGDTVCIEIFLTTFCQHAGPTPGWPKDPLHIAIEDGLVLGDTSDDPLYHLRNVLGETRFECLSEQVINGGHGG